MIGTHYKIQNITLAAVYKSSFESDVKFEGEHNLASVFPDSPLSNTQYHYEIKEDETITWPDSFGLGVGYRHSDRLSFALDVYLTRWSMYELETDDGTLNLLEGNADNADVADTTQVKAGVEYLWDFTQIRVRDTRRGLL